MLFLIRRRRLLRRNIQSSAYPDGVRSPESSYGVVFSSLAPSMSVVDSRISVFRTSASQKSPLRTLDPILEAVTGPDRAGTYSYTPFILPDRNVERPDPSVPLPSSPQMNSEIHSRVSASHARQSSFVSDMNIEPRSLSVFSLGLVSISSTSSRFAAPARRDSDDIIEGMSSRSAAWAPVDETE